MINTVFLLIGFAAGLTAALGVVAVAVVLARQNRTVAGWTGCVGSRNGGRRSRSFALRLRRPPGIVTSQVETNKGRGEDINGDSASRFSWSNASGRKVVRYEFSIQVFGKQERKLFETREEAEAALADRQRDIKRGEADRDHQQVAGSGGS